MDVIHRGCIKNRAIVSRSIQNTVLQNIDRGQLGRQGHQQRGNMYMKEDYKPAVGK